MSEITPVEELLLEVQRLNVTEAARNEFLRMIRNMAGMRIQMTRSALVIPHRVEVAKKLLSEGMTVAQTRDALMERVQIPRRSAYRVIALALNMRCKKEDNHG